MTQSEMILEALQRGEILTPLDALKRFGCFRLGARVYDLRCEGHLIDKRLIDVGNGKHVAAYSYAKGQLRLAV
jgi:hypothetical protein